MVYHKFIPAQFTVKAQWPIYEEELKKVQKCSSGNFEIGPELKSELKSDQILKRNSEGSHSLHLVLQLVCQC
jgi:hypothetical protein